MTYQNALESKEHELMGNIDEMGIYINWAGVLLRDLIEDYLEPLARSCAGRGYDTSMLIASEGATMLDKAEMIERFLHEVSNRHRAMSDLVFTCKSSDGNEDPAQAAK